MAEAGIKPEDIDAVVFSHAHIDHIGGVVDDSGKVLFPNAQYYIAQSDFDYWTDEGKMGGPLKDFIVHARKNLLPVRDRLVFYKDGQEFLPGIQAMAAPGHTVGHPIFMVTSDGKSFAFLGDLTHHPILLMEKPRMEFSYDTDPKQAAASRVKMLDMLAANKVAVMSYHYPWPGIGHVVKTGEGFHYIPSRWRWCSERARISGGGRSGRPGAVAQPPPVQVLGYSLDKASTCVINTHLEAREISRRFREMPGSKWLQKGSHVQFKRPREQGPRHGSPPATGRPDRRHSKSIEKQSGLKLERKRHANYIGLIHKDADSDFGSFHSGLPGRHHRRRRPWMRLAPWPRLGTLTRSTSKA